MISPLQAPHAQDLVEHLDLNSDEFTKADVTRDDVVAAIAKRAPTALRTSRASG